MKIEYSVWPRTKRWWDVTATFKLHRFTYETGVWKARWPYRATKFGTATESHEKFKALGTVIDLAYDEV